LIEHAHHRSYTKQKEIVKSRTAFLSGIVKNADSDNQRLDFLLARPDE
jgi:hypothetical protein